MIIRVNDTFFISLNTLFTANKHVVFRIDKETNGSKRYCYYFLDNTVYIISSYILVCQI